MEKAQLELNRHRFTIGDFVRVSAYEKLERVGKAKHLIHLVVEGVVLEGQITGIVVRHEGTIEPRHAAGVWGSKPDNRFRSEKRVELWEIKFGLMNRPVYAMEEYLEELLDDSLELPLVFCADPSWRKQMGKQLRRKLQTLKGK